MANKTWKVPYIDFQSALLAIFIALYILSSDDQSKGNIQDPSLFLATIEWSKDSRSDVDLFVKGPDGSVLNFKTKQTDIMSLDVDNVGTKQVDVVRREVASVKRLVPGRYVVNALLYSNRDNAAVNVKAQVLKLQGFSILCEADFFLTTNGQEATVCAFEVDSQEAVVAVDKGIQESLL